MRISKKFAVTYGGLTTTFRQDSTSSNTWHWVTTNASGTRIDGAEADSTSVLYMLWYHLDDPECKITKDEI